LVSSVGETLSLSRNVSVDVSDMQEWGWLLVQEESNRSDLLLDRNFELFFEELLPGWYDDWVIEERERLCQLQSCFADALVDLLIRNDRSSEALDTALKLVRSDPYREHSHVALIATYLSLGARSAALAHANRYKGFVRSEFGCESGDDVFSDAVSRLAVLAAEGNKTLTKRCLR